MSKIELGETDVALIFRESGIDIILPKMDDSASVPDHFHTAVCIGALLKQEDPIMMNYCQQRYDEMWGKINQANTDDQHGSVEQDY
jgi:hypothetical protein